MTFNVRGARFDDGPNRWTERLELNVHTILKQAPDLIGFQELHPENLAVYEERLPGYRRVLGPPYNNTPQQAMYPDVNAALNAVLAGAREVLGGQFAGMVVHGSLAKGKHYRLKSPERVLAEVRHILQHTADRRIMFCDNSFNVPHQHAVALCHAFAAEGACFRWGSGDIKPIGVTDEFCRLMKDSGCFYSLEALCRSKVPFGASLMVGAPGETPDTIAETLGVLSDYDIPLGMWVTVGVYLWTDYQDIVAEARPQGA